MRHTDFGAYVEQAAARIRQQEGGSHADEVETSMMLHIEPSSVDMRQAVRDLGPASTPMRLTRRQGAPGTYSPTGIWGDATLATASKGKIIVEGVVERMLQDIEALRAAIPPEPRPAAAAAPAAPAAPPPAPPRPPATQPGRCTSGDQRAIAKLADSFNTHWLNADAESLAALWAEEGDVVHPDGASERGRQTILQNRREQFGSAAPRGEGLATMVVKRGEAGWLFEAYRYTVTLRDPGPVPPTLLSKPGYPPIIK